MLFSKIIKLTINNEKVNCIVSSEQPAYFIDTRVEKEKVIEIHGWAYLKKSNTKGAQLFIKSGDYLALAKYGVERADVAIHFNNTKLVLCGFEASIEKNKIQNNLIQLILTDKKRNCFMTNKIHIQNKANTSLNTKIQEKVLLHYSVLRLKYSPKITVVIPVHDPKLWQLKECIDSVKKQTYQNFEISIVDDKSIKKEVLDYLNSINSSKIKVTFLKENKGISEATNTGILNSTGEFIALLDHDDVLHKNALLEVAKALNKNKKLDFIYTDEAKIDESGDIVDHFYKPDFSLDTLLAIPYIAHLNVYRKKTLEKIGLFRKEYDGSQDYDAVLRTTKITDKIHHIQKALYYWRIHENSTSKNKKSKNWAFDASKRAVNDYIKRNKVNAELVVLDHIRNRIKYSIEGAPKVTIIIPAGPKNMLIKCLNSIFKKTTYQNFDILVADNSFSDKTQKLLETFMQKYPGKINYYLDKTKPFNYSKINNTAIKKTKSEYVILLNDDTTVVTHDWIESMLEYAQQKRIGVVGAKLLYPNKTIQHAGVIVGIQGIAGHAFKYKEDSKEHYFGFSKIVRNVSAVTFACAMIRKDIFSTVGYLDEKKFSVAFNDVDFCLRAQEKGLLNIYTPFSVLTHFESVSRGVDDQRKNYRYAKEIINFRKKWKKYIQNDPYYNENLSKTTEGFEYGTLAPQASISKRAIKKAKRMILSFIPKK